MPPGTFVTEEWAYAGVRRNPGNLLIDEWFAGRGPLADKSLWFSKKLGDARFIIGGLYEVRIDRTGSVVKRHGAPQFTGRCVDDDRRLDWAARDARARLDRALDGAGPSGRDALDAALEPLRELIGTRRTYADREALMVTVMRRLMAPTPGTLPM